MSALINYNLLIHDKDPWLQLYFQNAAIAGILARDFSSSSEILIIILI